MTLHFEKVKKYYGAFLALDIPLCSINDGTWLVQGENGSGKTTLLKMIAGLHPFEGDINLNGLSIKKQRQHFISAVNYAEAEPLYPGFLKAKDLVELYCKTKRGNLNKAIALLKQLHIYDAYTKPLAAYSSGMVKKLSLALAFTGSAPLILLDEPFITIDVLAISVICEMIRSSQANGVSFIVTSHQLLPAEQLTFSGTLFAENHTILLPA